MKWPTRPHPLGISRFCLCVKKLPPIRPRPDRSIKMIPLTSMLMILSHAYGSLFFNKRHLSIIKCLYGKTSSSSWRTQADKMAHSDLWLALAPHSLEQTDQKHLLQTLACANSDMQTMQTSSSDAWSNGGPINKGLSVKMALPGEMSLMATKCL